RADDRDGRRGYRPRVLRRVRLAHPRRAQRRPRPRRRAGRGAPARRPPRLRHRRRRALTPFVPRGPGPSPGGPALAESGPGGGVGRPGAQGQAHDEGVLVAVVARPRPHRLEAGATVEPLGDLVARPYLEEDPPGPR